MTKTRTTYGVYNLIEWHALLRMGKASVKVLFTGGSITTQGVTPATFTTDNPVIQFAIEKSPEFINGRIKVVRRTKLNEDIEIECNAPRIASDVPDSASAPTPIPVPASESPASSVEEGENISGKSNDRDAEYNECTAPATTQVEFSCNDDAKDYLESKFGVTRSKLLNRDVIRETGEAYGVEIIFADNG